MKSLVERSLIPNVFREADAMQTGLLCVSSYINMLQKKKKRKVKQTYFNI